MVGRYYEDYDEGETIEHEKRRTVSESDNQRFCDMTMNQQPLHLDGEFAGESPLTSRSPNWLSPANSLSRWSGCWFIVISQKRWLSLSLTVRRFSCSMVSPSS